MYVLPTPVLLADGAARVEYHPARGMLAIGKVEYTLSTTEQATLAEAIDHNAEGVRCKLRDGALWVHVDLPEAPGHLLAILAPAPLAIEPAPVNPSAPVDPPMANPEQQPTDPPAPPENDARPEN